MFKKKEKMEKRYDANVFQKHVGNIELEVSS